LSKKGDFQIRLVGNSMAAVSLVVSSKKRDSLLNHAVNKNIGTAYGTRDAHTG
jgi:hypothetical protein